MQPIATWSFAPFLKGHRLGSYNRFDLLVFLYIAEQSIKSFSYMGKPKIYTDSVGEVAFSDFDCEVINCYDNVHDEIDTRLWAYTKILTYQKQIEPYLHFDLDFVLKRKVNIPQCDVFVQCKDTYKDTFTNDLENTGLNLPDAFKNKLLDNSLTVGVLGMLDMDLNKRYSDEARRYFELNNKNADTWKNTTMTNCILEQQLLMSHCIDKDVKFLSETECFNNNDFRHYVSYTKKASFACHHLHSKIAQRHHDILKEVENAIH